MARMHGCYRQWISVPGAAGTARLIVLIAIALALGHASVATADSAGHLERAGATSARMVLASPEMEGYLMCTTCFTYV
jgi:hypothetical protein